jgi:Amt family ammonium transporter
MLHLDTGNTAFTLLCASLVMLMTPGLAFFYGGLVGRRNVLAIMMQSFVSMGWTTVLWWAFGFSLCFSGDQKSGTDFFGIIGNLQWAGLRGITLATPSPNDTIPMLVFCAYQMMFAIITPALITGAFTNRITFKAYMLFLTAWLVLVYFPFVHMVWGGGLLVQWGVKDFAGGIVVHNIAGIAALASILYVGKRKVLDRGPHSIPLVALGTGLLWFGWYGFNAGSEFRVDSTTAVAIINTDFAASIAASTWMLVDWRNSQKP